MKYKCRSPKDYCLCCKPELRKHWEEGVDDYIKYHSTSKYKEYISAALQAFRKL